MNYIMTIAIAVLASLTTFACSEDGSTGIAPENNLKISVNAKNSNSMTEETFNSIIDSVESVYAPIVASEFNARLYVERGWDDGTVNAYASRSSDENGPIYKVKMFGGLARHEKTTEDAFALVICHEIGHHIGGAPKKLDWFGNTVWVTNEGQSDYWGTLKCLRRVWLGQNHAKVLSKKSVPASVKSQCERSFTNQDEVAICQRSALAGLSLGNLLRDLRNLGREEENHLPELDFNTPDSTTVSTTNHNHPAPQCRLDTFLTGSLCQIDFATNVDQEDVVVGSCARANNDSVGVRPLCWFNPNEGDEEEKKTRI